MALKYIIGDLRTGNITESLVLPVVKGSDKINIDINSTDSGTLEVSLKDVPGNWQTYLEPKKKMIALIDDELAFASSVIWAGWVNKTRATVRGTVLIQVVGIREWMASRIISNTYSGTVVNPKLKATYAGGDWRTVIRAMITECFSSSGIPSTAPKPPAVLGTLPSMASGAARKYEVLYTDAFYYTDAIDDVRDNLSDGEEYRFTGRWASSAKNRIVFDVTLGTNTQPHINENTTHTIPLADNTWKPTAFSQSASSDYSISRIIGHSKPGEGTTGSDYTVKTLGTNDDILIDEFFNPGVELTAAEMETQLTERLSYNSKLFKEAEFERVVSSSTELRTALSHLGAMAKFTGAGATEYFGLEMRIVGIEFSASTRLIKISLMQKASTYPTLPRDRNKTDGKDRNNNTPKKKRKRKSNNPIANPSPDSKVPNGGGDGGGNSSDGNKPKPPILTPGPPQIEEPPVDSFKTFGYNQMNGSNPTVSRYNKVPHLDRSRFNQSTGELIGINMRSRRVYGGYQMTDLLLEPESRYSDLEVWAVDMPSAFSGNVRSYLNNEHKKLVGTLPFELYKDLFKPLAEFDSESPRINSNPGNSREILSTNIIATADYSFFTSEDHKDIYIQVLASTTLRYVLNEFEQDLPRGKFECKSSVFKGVRNSEGLITSWQKIEGMLEYEDSGKEYIVVSNEVHEIKGNFYIIGSYNIPKVYDERYNFGEDSRPLGEYGFPSPELNFWSSSLRRLDLSFLPSYSMVEGESVAFFYTDGIADYVGYKYKADPPNPWAVRIDRQNNKIVMGVSRSNNNFVSKFWVSDLNMESLNFSKLFETDQEKTSLLWSRTSNSKQYDGRYSNYFNSGSEAPLVSKDNIYLLYADGEHLSQVSSVDGKIVILRSKMGSTGSMKSQLITSAPDSRGSLIRSAVSNSQKLSLFDNFQGATGSAGQGSYYKFGFLGLWGDKDVELKGFRSYNYKDKIYIATDWRHSFETGWNGNYSFDQQYWFGEIFFKPDYVPPSLPN